MLKVAVLVSGGGTNLQALLDSEARGENPHGKISLVVASKPGVYALERAKNAGVPGVVVRRKDYAAAGGDDVRALDIGLFKHETKGLVFLLAKSLPALAGDKVGDASSKQILEHKVRVPEPGSQFRGKHKSYGCLAAPPRANEKDTLRPLHAVPPTKP